MIRIMYFIVFEIIIYEYSGNSKISNRYVFEFVDREKRTYYFSKSMNMLFCLEDATSILHDELKIKI